MSRHESRHPSRTRLALAAGLAPARAPTPQQLELLKSLSPSDRAALMAAPDAVEQGWTAVCL